MRKRLTVLLSMTLFFLIIAAGCSNDEKSSGKGSGNESANGEEYVIKIGTENPTDHPMTIATEKFKELAEEKGEGQIVVETYPNNQLGTQTEMNEATRDGRIQATYSGMSYIGGNFEPKYNVFSLPFVITRDNLDKAFELLDGEVGQELTSSLEEKGMTVLGYANIGFRNITNNKHEIKTPEDLKGIKIRLQSNPVHIDTFNELGADTVNIDFAEVYTALQQGVIDAQENPFDLIYSNGFYEVQEYLSQTGHFFDFAGIWFNKKHFDELPENIQEILKEAGQEAVEFHRDLYLEEEASYLEKLKEEGMQIYEPTTEDIEEFQDKVRPVYQKFLDEAEDRELSERILNELGFDF